MDPYDLEGLHRHYEELLRANERPVVVVLTGAGVSAESGIPTFRDANGLWEGHDVHEVASPVGWARNPETVLRFYNERRKAAWVAKPNAAHQALAKLESSCLTIVVTQNVDSLHERAGSSHVLHLHGELSKVRSTGNSRLVYDIEGRSIALGDLCEEGCQLRPHIVWFGEDVPLIGLAAWLCERADYFLIVGTSLQVYPAAGLIDCVPPSSRKYVVDRSLPALSRRYANLMAIEKPASLGVREAIEDLTARIKSENQS